jgi:hypothetical protein
MGCRIMTERIRAALAAGLLALAAACTAVTSQVASTGSLPASGRGASIAVVAGEEALAGSLFFQDTKAVIEREFAARGYRVVAMEDQPLYLALASYTVDEGRTDLVTFERRRPVFRYKRGVGNVFVGYDTEIEVREIDTFGREVELIVNRMDDPEGPRRVYEGRAVSRGECGNVTEVADEMFLALFAKFPKGSGRVRIEADLNC